MKNSSYLSTTIATAILFLAMITISLVHSNSPAKALTMKDTASDIDNRLVLEIIPEELLTFNLDYMQNELEQALSDAKLNVTIEQITRNDNILLLTLNDDVKIDEFSNIILRLAKKDDWELRADKDRLYSLRQTQKGIGNLIDLALASAIELIDHRTRSFDGTKASINRNDKNQIIVDIANTSQLDAIKKLITSKAKFEIKLVNDNFDPDLTAQGKVDIGSIILPYPKNPSGVPNVAVFRDGGIDGQNVESAFQSFDQITNQPVVSIIFDREGAQKFALITEEYVGKRLALIVDDEIISAPVINEPILDGVVQIWGDFTIESANQFAMSIRSGRLPIGLKLIEDKASKKTK